MVTAWACSGDDPEPVIVSVPLVGSTVPLT